MTKLKRFLRFLFSKQSISESLSWGIDRNWGKMRPDYSVRKDLERMTVCQGVRVEVYWKKLKFGKGPAVSLFMLDEEILRIDCFGYGAGHMHAAFFLPGKGENRFWMYESTVAEQVARARFELSRNVHYYQCRVPNPRIRALKVDPQKMKEASEWAFERMTSYIDVDSQLDKVTRDDAFSDDIE